MSVSSDSESEEEVYYDNSLATSTWNSNVNVGGIFESLSVNTVSSNQRWQRDTFKSEELMQSDSDLWIKHLNTLWDVRFE